MLVFTSVELFFWIINKKLSKDMRVKSSRVVSTEI
jgi:hypothetical protein